MATFSSTTTTGTYDENFGGSSPNITGTSGDDRLDDLVRDRYGNTSDPGRNDYIAGLGGNDEIWVHNGDDTADGGDGNDIFFDVVSATNADGTYAHNGNDRFYGGYGNDRFFAGSGQDLYNGGSGVDWVHYGRSVTVDLINATGLSEGNVDQLVSIENVSGSEEDDFLFGSNVNNVLNGNNGLDGLEGRGGHDTLQGGGHNDRIAGGDGNDVLFGGWGEDQLTGGTGWDRFVFSPADRANGLVDFDTIVDFQQGVDKLDVSLFDARSDMSGDQAFTFDGTGDGWGDSWSSDRGEIEFHHANGFTYVSLGLSDGPATAAFRLKGTYDLSASDFVL